MRIDKHVPIPEGERRGRSKVFPLDTLEVGESFTVPLSQERSLRSAASQANKAEDNKSFTCQKQPEGVIRCWRVT